MSFLSVDELKTFKKITGGDDGKWVHNRIIAVECKNMIPPEKQDKKLLEKLYAEREGIVYRAITALQAVIKNGYRFSEPKSVIEARKRYINENNTVISFWNECIVQRSRINDKATVGKIYEVYRAWCSDNNHGFAKTAREFRDTIAAHLNTTLASMTICTKHGITYSGAKVYKYKRRFKWGIALKSNYTDQN